MRSLEWANHYQQEAGRHPVPSIIECQSTRVELMTDGRGWVQEQGELIEVLPGDLIWHQVSDRCICRSDFEKPYRCLSVVFKNTGDRDPQIPRISTWGDMNEVRNFTRDILRSFHDDGFNRQALCDYAYSRFFYQVQKYHYHGGGQAIPQELRSALEYIQKHYHYDIALPDLARHIGWSVPHLHDMCRKHLQTSPHKLIIRQRLLVAKEQLSSKHSTVHEVAAYCGFNSTTHFCRSFKKEIGSTPIKFRTEFLKRELK
ncbi:MAG: helix-turn-helix transcriptional regulator [Planctomycetes bacterium]|nr:helix-turn-helix transcriptional regulator [Planctomycetota bacterium]